MKLNVGFGSKTILESMNSYLKTEDYLKNKRIIDEEGLQSDQLIELLIIYSFFFYHLPENVISITIKVTHQKSS